MKQDAIEKGMTATLTGGQQVTVVWPSYCHPYEKMVCVALPDGTQELVSPASLAAVKPTPQ